MPTLEVLLIYCRLFPSLPLSPASVGTIENLFLWLCTEYNYYNNLYLSLGDNVFHSCTSLSQVILVKGITIISNQMFYSATRLISIDIPSTITFIGTNQLSNYIFIDLFININYIFIMT